MPFTSPQAHIWDQFNVIDNACARANISDPSSGTVEFNVHTDQGTIREVVLSLKTFGDVLRCAGADVTTIHAQSTDEEGFRAALKAALVGASFVGLNFDHAALKMAGRGHFSPAAAYDAVSDRVLVLDVARYNYEPFWVAVPALFEAMNHSAQTLLFERKKRDSSHYRGYRQLVTRGFVLVHRPDYIPTERPVAQLDGEPTADRTPSFHSSDVASPVSGTNSQIV